MNILFDLLASQPEANLKYHGGSEYAKAVFWALAAKTEERLFCIYDEDRYLDNDIRLYCSVNRLPLLNIRNYKKLDSIIEKHKIERFYSALPLEGQIQRTLPVTEKVKCIITIHGLRSLELVTDKYELKYINKPYQYIKYFYKNLRPAKFETDLQNKIKSLIKNYQNPTIITVSDHSKRSIKYYLPEICDKKIHVFYSPIIKYSESISKDSVLKEKKIESKKYFLLLSAGIWQKNSYRALSAFNSLLTRRVDKEYKFVIIGAPDLIKREFTNTSIIYLNYVEREELESLLKNAYALVFPSLNEGFGYPPLEAFKYGTGVIASAIGSVMEICENAALYFNPNSVTELRLRLLQAIDDPGFILNTKPRFDRYMTISNRQLSDLDALVDIICN